MRTLLLLLIAIPGLGHADDPDPLAAREARELGKLADSHTSLARWCSSRGLRGHACRHWREVLLIRPDDATARRALHYVKDGDGWRATRDYDTRDTRRGAARARAVKALEARRRRHDAIGTGAYSALARAAAELAPDAADAVQRRRRYLRRMLAFDPENGVARTALGYRRNTRGHWVDKALVDRLSTMSAGKPVDDRRPLEAGLTLHKRRSDHFELAHFRSDAWTATMMRHAELAHTALTEWLRPTREVLSAGDPLVIYSFETPDYQRVIQEHSQTTQQIKDYCKRCSSAQVRGTVVIANQIFDRDTEATELDRLVYLAGRNIAFYLAGGSKTAPAWLREGLAWELTLRTLGTRYHSAVTLNDGTTSQVEDQRWSQTDRWPGYLRELVLLGRDPQVATLLAARTVNDIRDADAALAWSLTTYLLERDGKGVGRLLEALAAGKSPEAALQAGFDLTTAQLQQAWHAWVLERY